jgi:hypothetical protein
MKIAPVWIVTVAVLFLIAFLVTWRSTFSEGTVVRATDGWPADSARTSAAQAGLRGEMDHAARGLDANRRGLAAATTGAYLSISVLDGQATPVEFAELYFQDRTSTHFIGTTDPNGTLRLPWQAAGNRGKLIACHDSKGCGSAQLGLAPIESLAISISLEPYAAISGRVSYPANVPSDVLEAIGKLSILVDAVNTVEISGSMGAAQPDATEFSRADVSHGLLWRSLHRQLALDAGQKEYMVDGLRPGVSYRVRLVGPALLGYPHEALVQAPSGSSHFL